MSHTMRSTPQPQNVLVELTHKPAHTCLDLSQIPPASDGRPLIITTPTVFKGAIPWLFHQLVYVAQTIGVASVIWEGTTPKRRCVIWHCVYQDTACRLLSTKGISTHSECLEHSSLLGLNLDSARERWANFNPALDPRLRWFPHHRVTAEPHRTCLNI